MMLAAILAAPPAASLTDRAISSVMAVCCSTAEAMVACWLEIWAMISLISSIDVTAAAV